MPKTLTTRSGPHGLFTTILRRIADLSERRKAAAAERESYTALMALSDGELWDVGLCRGDLAATVRRHLRQPQGLRPQAR